MKRLISTSLYLIILLVCVGCQWSNESGNDLIIVDVTINYPKKELILQDFMDVEYIPLETNDKFVCGGLVMACGSKYLVVRNRNSDGNIYIFDRSGKGISKINCKGKVIILTQPFEVLGRHPILTISDRVLGELL